MRFPDEPPAHGEWTGRCAWFEVEEERARAEGSFLLSEQACALSLEVERAFAAGAWIAVVVLAAAVQELTLREAELGGVDGSAYRLIEDVGGHADFHWLRRRRNEICHGNGGAGAQSEALTVDLMHTNAAQQEGEARRAILVMFAAMYMTPWS